MCVYEPVHFMDAGKYICTYGCVWEVCVCLCMYVSVNIRKSVYVYA